MAKEKTEKEVVEKSPVSSTPKTVKPLDKKFIKQKYSENVYNDKENNQPMFLAWKKLYKELCLPEEDARAFLGGRDPQEYFREGLLHTSFINMLENLLPEDEEEVMVMRKVLPWKDILLFKKKRTNVYILLIPKRLARFEMDDNGEFINEHINYDISAIAFTGSGSPAAYEEGYFIQQLRKTLVHLQKVAEQRRLFDN